METQSISPQSVHQNIANYKTADQKKYTYALAGVVLATLGICAISARSWRWKACLALGVIPASIAAYRHVLNKPYAPLHKTVDLLEQVKKYPLKTALDAKDAGPISPEETQALLSIVHLDRPADNTPIETSELDNEWIQKLEQQPISSINDKIDELLKIIDRNPEHFLAVPAEQLNAINAYLEKLAHCFKDYQLWHWTNSVESITATEEGSPRFQKRMRAFLTAQPLLFLEKLTAIFEQPSAQERTEKMNLFLQDSRWYVNSLTNAFMLLTSLPIITTENPYEFFFSKTVSFTKPEKTIKENYWLAHKAFRTLPDSHPHYLVFKQQLKNCEQAIGSLTGSLNQLGSISEWGWGQPIIQSASGYGNAHFIAALCMRQLYANLVAWSKRLEEIVEAPDELYVQDVMDLVSHMSLDQHFDHYIDALKAKKPLPVLEHIDWSEAPFDARKEPSLWSKLPVSKHQFSYSDKGELMLETKKLMLSDLLSIH